MFITKKIRSVLEQAVAVWAPGLTKCDVTQIERVQKTACAVILGDKHINYTKSLKALNMKTLENRRSELCLNFAKKAHNSEKFRTWFANNDSKYCKTRSEKNVLKLVKTRTQKYKKSAIPYLTNILNNYLKSQVKS